MDLLPKRITVFLDSTHGEQTDNRVTHVLTEAIETDDDEALVVRIIHAQIPTPYPIWIEEGHNTLVAGISMYGSHFDLYGEAVYHSSYANAYLTERQRQFVVAPHNVGDRNDNFLQYILQVPPGGYTPESLATWMSDTLTDAFTWKVHNGLGLEGSGTNKSKEYHLNFPYNGKSPMPILAGERTFAYGTGQVKINVKEILSRAGAGDELGTIVSVSYDRSTKKFTNSVKPRQVIRWSHNKYWTGETFVQFAAGSTTEQTNYLLDIFNYRKMAFFISDGFVKTSDKMIDILGLSKTPDNSIETPTACSGMVASHQVASRTFRATSGNALGRWDIFYGNIHGTSESALDYPATTRNIHVKTNLATNSVVDSFLGSKTNTLAVIPAHSAELGFHYAGASDSVFSSMISTNSINRITIDLTDEHNVPLNIGGDEFTIGLEMQYVRISVLQNELKDVRDRRLYIHEKQKDEKKRAHRNVKTKRRERNKKKKIKKVINTIRKKDGTKTTGK